MQLAPFTILLLHPGTRNFFGRMYRPWECLVLQDCVRLASVVDIQQRLAVYKLRTKPDEVVDALTADR
jgi:hypothetical protein